MSRIYIRAPDTAGRVQWAQLVSFDHTHPHRFKVWAFALPFKARAERILPAPGWPESSGFHECKSPSHPRFPSSAPVHRQPGRPRARFCRPLAAASPINPPVPHAAPLRPRIPDRLARGKGGKASVPPDLGDPRRQPGSRLSPEPGSQSGSAGMVVASQFRRIEARAGSDDHPHQFHQRSEDRHQRSQFGRRSRSVRRGVATSRRLDTAALSGRAAATLRVHLQPAHPRQP